MDPQNSPYRYVIAGLAFLLNACFGLSFFVIGPVAPYIIDDYQISHSEAGLLTGITILAQTILAIPGSMLVGRIPVKALITVGWFLAAAPALTLLAFDYSVLLITRIVFGASFAILLPALGPLLMYWFRPRELPLVNGLNLAVTALAMSLSTLIAAPLSEAIGWKEALSVFGFVNLAGAVVWVFLGRVGQSAKAPVRSLSLGHAWRVMKSKTALLLAAADAGPLAQYTALVAWLPAFYFEVHDISLTRAGAMLGMLPLGRLRNPSRRRVAHYADSESASFPPGARRHGGFRRVRQLPPCGLLPRLRPPCCSWAWRPWLYVPILMTLPMELPRMAPEQVSLMWAAIMTVGGAFTFVSPLGPWAP